MVDERIVRQIVNEFSEIYASDLICRIVRYNPIGKEDINLALVFSDFLRWFPFDGCGYPYDYFNKLKKVRKRFNLDISTKFFLSSDFNTHGYLSGPEGSVSSGRTVWEDKIIL